MAARGFTLIELLVVMAVLALVVGTVPLIFAGSFGTASLKASARTVADGLRFARSQAIVHNREVGFTINVTTRAYSLTDGRRAGRLRGEPEIRLFTARSERIDERTGSIRFFPDGGSTGGRVTLAKEQREYHVDIDWLTGRVSVRD